MAGKKSRFEFLDEVTAEPPQPPKDKEEPAPHAAPAPRAPEAPRGYLYQPRPRTEPLAALGNRVRLPAKEALERYVGEVRKAGHPVNETRVLEALMLLLDEDEAVRSHITVYLTGGGALID